MVTQRYRQDSGDIFMNTAIFPETARLKFTFQPVTQCSLFQHHFYLHHKQNFLNITRYLSSNYNFCVIYELQ